MLCICLTWDKDLAYTIDANSLLKHMTILDGLLDCSCIMTFGVLQA